jgi:phosphoglycolate phosphatase
MIRYQCIIFDWDGTVMDSANKIVNTMQIAARMSNITVPSYAEVAHIIGISLKPAIAQLFGLVDEAKIDEITANYKTAFIEHDQTPCPLFAGAQELLSHLHPHTRLAVATGKARRGLQRAWDNSATGHYFIDSCCADEAKSKPHPDMLEQILARQGLSAKQCLMVGDTSYDMQMAKAIGMDRIGVNYGVHSVEQIQVHQPLAIIERPLDLLQHI